MKLMLAATLLLGAFVAPATPVRFEAEGVRVGTELVTGAAISLKESLLVSGSVVESLSGESLAVSLGEKQVALGAGLRLTRTADGFKIGTHGMAFTVESAGVVLPVDRAAAFKVTEKGFDFGALGTLEGASFAARVTTATAPAVAAEVPQEVQISPEKPLRQNRLRVLRRVYSSDPLNSGHAANSISVRLVPRLSPDGAP